MGKFNKIIVATFLLALLSSALYAADEMRLLRSDLNTVLDIQSQKGNVVFLTDLGTKTFYPKTSEWVYSATVDNKSIKVNRNVWKYSNIPEWYKKNWEFIWMDDLKHPNWLIFSERIRSKRGLEIINRWTKESVVVDEKNVRAIEKIGNTIWVSVDGCVLELNPSENIFNKYYSLPRLTYVIGIIDTGHGIYYCDSSYGLFKYDQETHYVHGIDEVNELGESAGSTFSSMILKNGYLYILCNREVRDDNANARDSGGKESVLIIYNCRDGNVVEHKNKLSFADQMENYQGKIVMWGQNGSLGGCELYDDRKNESVFYFDKPVLIMEKTSGADLKFVGFENEQCIETIFNFDVSLLKMKLIKSHVISRSVLQQKEHKYNWMKKEARENARFRGVEIKGVKLRTVKLPLDIAKRTIEDNLWISEAVVLECIKYDYSGLYRIDEVVDAFDVDPDSLDTIKYYIKDILEEQLSNNSVPSDLKSLYAMALYSQYWKLHSTSWHSWINTMEKDEDELLGKYLLTRIGRFRKRRGLVNKKNVAIILEHATLSQFDEIRLIAKEMLLESQ